MKFPVCPQACGLKVVSFVVEAKGPAGLTGFAGPPRPAEPKGPAKLRQAVELQQTPHVSTPSKAPLAADNWVSGNEAWISSAKEPPMSKGVFSPLFLGNKWQIRENLNRVDTRLCFSLAREDLGLQAQLLKQRRGLEAQCKNMDMDIPDKLLPTPALQSKKHAVELEIAKAQLQLHGKPTAVQVELREALERELCRRIPGRRAEQSKEKTCLRAFSNHEFLKAYPFCARQLYMQAGLADTPYESLVSLWGKWQMHTQEAEIRFGEAWLWQYV